MSISLKQLIKKITSQLVVHTSGSWRYIKLGNGLVVAWAVLTKSVANTTTSAQYGGYRSAEQTLSIPSGIFDSTPTWAWATKNNANSLRLMNITPSSATSVSFYTGSAESTTVNITISLLVVGGYRVAQLLQGFQPSSRLEVA